MRPGARLGVDVGSVRIGVATSDPDASVATPLRTVRRDPAGVADTAEVAHEAGERGVLEIVVGLPLSMDGVERAAAQTARSWAVALAKQVPGVVVRLVDERLSTVDAQRALHAAGRTARTSREIIDQQAAVLILQAALDSERVSGHAPGEIVGGRKPRTRQSRRRPSEGRPG
ncbi:MULTISPECIES: Holliday junction resolvase RuvX [Allobranchiibius]|uniref:Putative pre-16S rRNA nuclease n=1 Tax=Allobranchiibius huperziae TaxID=1874116 RepID=A0A853DHE1_9MICO|nr:MULTISPECIES: Holliday junction resolvase RuvX [Allobranchiibius]NYJ74454.1 putative Holliday junction resolvase [Allobranchiibius huperziae]UIJ34159.1 Holliday junction resolvase RuvX [Allobranchiibius sp. GilTou73]